MEKIVQFWQTLDEKQQIYAIIFAVILLIWLLFMSLYLPIKIQHQTLNTQLHSQHNITQQLISVGEKPSKFSAIKRKKAKSIIAKIAKQRGLSVDLKLDDKKLSLVAKDQEFNNLKKLLLLLRQRYAITTIKANISKTKDGFVDAKLTLILP